MRVALVRKCFVSLVVAAACVCVLLGACAGQPTVAKLETDGSLGAAENAEVKPEKSWNLADATISVDDQIYTGFELMPSVTVELEGSTLKEGLDYTLTYADNIESGEAHVSITAAGDYVGTAEASFTIEPHEEGWDEIDGTPYHYGSDGLMSTDTFVLGVDGSLYYLGKDGTAVRDSWVIHNGALYYIASNAHPTTNAWVSYKGARLYLGAKGTPVVNDWVYDAGLIYYCGADGVMVTGLVTIDDEAYIFNDDGSLRIISEDEQLDRYVCRIIRDNCGFDVRRAYDYVAYSFDYQVGSTRSDFENWTEYYAKELYETGHGNCFGFSSLYHFLLRAMGYDSKVIAGICQNRRNGNLYDHCWVEVYTDEGVRVCDPVFEVAYTYSGIDSYFITYEDNAAADIWLLYYSW